MNSKIQAAEENLIHVYNRFPIALDHGKGMYLYDTDGKEYLDFAAGFAVTGLGYDNKELNEALKLINYTIRPTFIIMKAAGKRRKR